MKTPLRFLRAVVVAMLAGMPWGAAWSQGGTGDRVPFPPMAGQDGYVVFPEVPDMKEHEDAAECIRRVLEREVPRARRIERAAFQDALYPWMEGTTKPRYQEDIGNLLARPLIQGRLSEIGTRYLILVFASRMESPVGIPGQCILVHCYGRGFYTVDTRLVVRVWDTRNRQAIGTSTSEGRGAGLDGAGLLPLILSLGTGVSCSEAGAAIAKALVAGTPE